MSSSKQDSSVPSWDEFDIDHQELDYDEEEEPVCEPNALEFGPGLPPEFSTAERSSSSSNPVNDFVISTTEIDNLLNDPEDPHQRRAASSAPKRKVIGPELPPDLRKEDSFNLPSITSTSDFQRPCSSRQAVTVGPTLPSGFLISTSSDQPSSIIEAEDAICLPPDEPSRQVVKNKAAQQQNSTSFLPIVSTSLNGGGDGAQNSKRTTLIGPALPPDFCDSTSETGFVDEPSTSSSFGVGLPDRKNTSDKPNGSGGNSKQFNGDVKRKSSANGSHMELPLDDDDSNSNFVSGSEDYVAADKAPSGSPGADIPTAGDSNDQPLQQVDDEEEEEEELVGPALPPAFKNAEEEDADYFSRFVEYETRKKDGGASKREEWMTELPQKLKQSYGLTAKNSFSRVTASDSGNNSAWTDVNGKPSSSKASTSKVSNLVSSSKEMRPSTSSAREEKRESLLDVHQRKRKINDNEASSSSDGSARRPFNRDTDMEIRGFGNMNSEEAKTRLGNLSSRFTSGS